MKNQEITEELGHSNTRSKDLKKHVSPICANILYRFKWKKQNF